MQHAGLVRVTKIRIKKLTRAAWELAVPGLARLARLKGSIGINMKVPLGAGAGGLKINRS